MHEDLNYIKLISSEFLNLMDIIQPSDEKAQLSIEAGIEKIKETSNKQFIYYLLGGGIGFEKIDKWIEGKIDEGYNRLNPETRRLIKKPGATKTQTINFLYQYLNYFEAEQRRIEPWLIRAVHNSEQQLNKDPLTFVKNIHPRLFIKDNYLEFHKAKTYQFHYQDLKRIYINPSTFIEPHLLLGIYPNSISIGLHVDVPSNLAKAAIPMDFIKIMKALSDPTRAAILKNLLEHPYCTKQLAELHQISEPAVVKHLKVLSEAELIWGERKGYYVFYKGIPEKLEMLTVEIHQFIDMKNYKQRE